MLELYLALSLDWLLVGYIAKYLTSLICEGKILLSLNYLGWEAVVVMVIIAVKIYFTIDDVEKEESMNSCPRNKTMAK